MPTTSAISHAKEIFVNCVHNIQAKVDFLDTTVIYILANVENCLPKVAEIGIVVERSSMVIKVKIITRKVKYPLFRSCIIPILGLDFQLHFIM